MAKAFRRRPKNGAAVTSANLMRFPPGTVVPLYFDDGTQASAKPFYYATGPRGGMRMRLVADNGDDFEKRGWIVQRL